MKRFFALFSLLCLFCAGAAAQSPCAALPVPAAMQTVDGFEPVALYCGATQGMYRHQEQTIDLTQPFVCFGQYDCWTMVAQGTEENFGPVGWIEGGLFDAQDVPELPFDDSYAAMVEDEAIVTNDLSDSGAGFNVTLPRGTAITVLAAYGEWLYVQTEIDGVPARAFIPAACVL